MFKSKSIKIKIDDKIHYMYLGDILNIGDDHPWKLIHYNLTYAYFINQFNEESLMTYNRYNNNMLVKQLTDSSLDRLYKLTLFPK